MATGILKQSDGKGMLPQDMESVMRRILEAGRSTPTGDAKVIHLAPCGRLSREGCPVAACD